MSNKPVKNSCSQSYYPTQLSRLFSDDLLNFFKNDDLPAVNVKESKKAYKLEISAPGVNKEDVNLWVDGDILYISADTVNEVDTMDDDDETIINQQFSYTSFSRSFLLPKNVDTTKIKAVGKNGILKITLPKMENAPENTVKYIEIQ